MHGLNEKNKTQINKNKKKIFKKSFEN